MQFGLVCSGGAWQLTGRMKITSRDATTWGPLSLSGGVCRGTNSTQDI